MYELKTPTELRAMTVTQLHRYIHVIEDRLMYTELQREKFQCRAQGLTTLRELYSSQTQRFRKSNFKVASLQRQLYQYKREDHFKIPTTPLVKRPRLNKRRKTALRRRTASIGSLASTATFNSDSFSEGSPSSPCNGTPFFYTSPQPNFTNRIASFEYLASTPVSYNESVGDTSKYMDTLYSPSRSPVVDLDSTPRI